MCGLVGFIAGSGTHNYKDKRNFITEGLYLSALRGLDGTGVASVTSPKLRASVWKRGLAAADFLQLKVTDRMLYNVDSSLAVLGHTRAATKGNVTDMNSHPFQYGHITLVHNGGIHNFRSLVKKDQEPAEDVDSAFVCASLAVNGERETLEAVQGDYCFIWHNANDGSVNIARNNGRPLWWINVPEWKGIAWASEMTMLAAVLARNAVKVDGKFLHPQEHLQYKFLLSKPVAEYYTIPFVPSHRKNGPAMTGTNGTSASSNNKQASRQTSTSGSGGGQGGRHSEREADDQYAELAEYYKTKPKVSGRPSTKKGIRRAAQRLKDLKLSFDATYGFTPKEFRLYTNQARRGVMIGVMAGTMQRGRLCEVHDVDVLDFEKMLKIRGCLGNVVNVTNIKKGQENSIVVMVVNQRFYDQQVVPFKLYDDDIANDDDETPSNQSGTVTQLLRGPNHVLFDKRAWAELVSDGCVYCTGPCLPETSTKMLWVGPNHDQPLCSVCATDAEALESLGISKSAN